MSKKKPTVLMILDGYGLNDKVEGNAVKQANTPVMDDLMANCPFVEGQASGMAVGLPEGQMGNSEVGHLNMGAGRIVYQELTRITKSIQDGDFFENKAFLEAVASGVNECRRQNRQASSLTHISRCTKESLRHMKSRRIKTTGEGTSTRRNDEVVGARKTGDAVEKDNEIISSVSRPC